MIHFQNTTIQLLGNQFRIYRRGRPLSIIAAQMLGAGFIAYGFILLVMLAAAVLAPESAQ